MKLKTIVLSFFFAGSIIGSLSAEVMDKNIDNIISARINNTSEDYRLHTVVKGDTAYSIAAAYNTTVKDIYRLNPEAEKGVRIGETLKVPITKATPTNYYQHIIKSQETLYGISRQYSLSIEDIVSANPGLNESSFKAGKTIRIPLYSGTSESVKPEFGNPNIEHKVVKGETLYGISRYYNISEESIYNLNPSVKEGGLKEGMTLAIPKRQIQSLNNTVSPREDNIARIGILLPFLDTKGSIQQEKLIEYYEGLLLAVKDVKEKGLDAEIYTFDIGSERDTKKLESILGTTEMSNLNLIIGGISKQQIDILSKFSKKTGTKYIVPFSSQIQDINMNPNIFQVTTPPSSLFPEIIFAFCNQFNDYNIIFVSEIGSDNNKADFVSALKKGLTKANITFKTVGASANLSNDLKASFNSYAKNIIIPTSSSDATLRRITTALKSTEIEEQVSLFGYPDWQTYGSLTSDLHTFDSYIYSIFYLDEQQQSVQRFTQQFKYWYNRNLINSFPKFGCLGYDTGLYFLTAFNKHANFFENKISSITVPTLQSAIHFDQPNNNRSGYINNGLYFVHYKKDSTIEKIDCNK